MINLCYYYFMELHLHNYYNAAAAAQSQKPDVEAHEQHSSWTNIAKPNVNYFYKNHSKQQKKNETN